jgi:preprotein translocase subunit SecG
MSTGVLILTIIHIIMAVSLIVIVLLQSGKSAGLSGSIAGAAETFFGKNKGRTLDSLLSKWTTVAAIVFLITSIILTVKSMHA